MAEHVVVRSPRITDEEEFLQAVRRSRQLHRGWVYPPASTSAYRDYLAKGRQHTHQAFLVVRKRIGGLVGVVNVSEIVRGNFQSAYLGYYAFVPHAGTGLMREGLSQVIERAFRRMKLHRLEANIQPDNSASIALVRSLRFGKEGFSPRYLKIGGRWCDHERWAIIAENWKPDGASRMWKTAVFQKNH